MLLKRLTRNVAALALAALAAGAAPAVAAARDEAPGSLSTVTVTVTSKDDGAAPRLAPSDFAVYRGKSRQEIVDVKGPGEAPVNVAVLIQEGLDQGVGNEIERIKEFILALPEGSQVMVGYLRGTGLSVRQPFTTNLEEAAGELRIPISTPSVGSAPFIGLIEALDEFDGLAGRNQVVLVSNGLPEISEDESFELWFVREDGTPVAAGVFEPAEGPSTVVLDGEMQAGDTIAVTVEPQGGSPSGEPSSEPIVAIPTA